MDLLLNIYKIYSYYDYIYLLDKENILYDFHINIILLYTILKKYKEQYIKKDILNDFIIQNFITSNKNIKIENVDELLDIILNYNISLEELINYIDSHNNIYNIKELKNK